MFLQNKPICKSFSTFSTFEAFFTSVDGLVTVIMLNVDGDENHYADKIMMNKVNVCMTAIKLCWFGNIL